MPVELVRDIINYEKLIDEAASQTMVNGDIVIGERSPECGKILSMDGKVVISSSDVIDNNVAIEGKMLFEILYSGEGEEIGVHKVSATSNFTHTLQIIGASPSMSCKIKTDIEHMDYELVSNRKIKVNAVIDIKGTVYQKDVIESIKDMSGDDLQTLKDMESIDEFIGETTEQTVVRGKIDAPSSSAAIKDILTERIHIHKKDVTVAEGRVIVNACALVDIMYELEEGGTIVQTQEDIAFTHEIEMPDVTASMKCDLSFKIGDIYDEIAENDDGERKDINVEVVVDVTARIYGHKEFDTIVDAYSPVERYEFETENIKTISFLGENSDINSMKDKITVSSENGEIGDIKSILTNPVITDIKIVDDKVILEGVVECTVIYMTRGEEGFLSSYMEELPVKCAINMPKATMDMIPDGQINIEGVSFEKLSTSEIEVKLEVEYTAKVYMKNSLTIVKNVEESEIPEEQQSMPSIILYVVQNKDTMWKIAKKYSASMEDIIKFNELENPDELTPGMKIFIPKKSFMK